MQYDFTKQSCDLDQLTKEIQSSNIAIALDYITKSGSSLSVFFKASLSESEQTTLSNLVSTHIPIPLEESIIPVIVQEQPPFAAPSFRTKRKGAPNFIEMAPSQEQTIDLPITEERYCHGGVIVFSGIEVGDTVTGEVYDKDGVIPNVPYPLNTAVTYRQALCEAWPVVANYLDDEPLPPGSGFREINTYPLNAKITAGLYLRIKIKTCALGSTRKIGLGYYLTKKL